MRFEAWWVENRVKNPISVIYRLDGQPHEVIIKETKYFVKELYSANKNITNQLNVSVFIVCDIKYSVGICMLGVRWTSSAR